tara:strand:+ start:687 stop:821 length:135 start_codon:yes stop_codon:yes gene_type:complete
MKLAGQGKWNEILHDSLSKKEQEENDHIIEEGRDAEIQFIRKHL